MASIKMFNLRNAFTGVLIREKFKEYYRSDTNFKSAFFNERLIKNEYLENEKGLPFNLARNTKPANYMGLPSLSVPCGFSDEFTPISFQLIGPPFSETQLFNLGHCFQETTNFHKKIPKHVEFSDS